MVDRVLAAYCRTYNVTDIRERDDAAALIFELFYNGHRDEESILAEMIRLRPIADL
jgi:hypothetical protein